ncbi:cyclin-dependent kinase inhibitor 1-like [Sinocyclocheilus grahami]|uniref:cyclin-dependent kinase inhibitor 1-like n=1 Tax=Sinocyclocheilus grahami TaxID=75366 RepID=UPI0007AD183E|nr:PREDICTED: cyclin-dependent kinase inhibitor 1-like [Sinocyclocheilus grahami]
MTWPLRRLLWAETSSGRACPGSRCPSCTAPFRRSIRRWGFDLATETPLVGGDFQWEGVSGVKVPVLYRAVQEEHPSRSSAGKENAPRTPKRYSVVLQNVEKTPEKRTELKRKQTNITDFYLAKKRGVAV